MSLSNSQYDILFTCYLQSNGEEVSIFAFDVKNSSPDQVFSIIFIPRLVTNIHFIFSTFDSQ